MEPTHKSRLQLFSALGTALTLCLALPAHGAGPSKAAAVAGNPMIGMWSWTLPDGCIEKYLYLGSGLMSGTSGSEYVEEKYEISPVPDPGGFYKLSGRTLKDTGGLDCGGSNEDHTGKAWTAYIRFSADGNKYIACVEPNLKSCGGPYSRVDR